MSTMPVVGDRPEDLDQVLADARNSYEERPEQVLAEARLCVAQADVLGEDTLKARALGLACLVSIHRGEMREALTLALDAERTAGETADPVTRCELAAANSTLRFLAGSYAEALSQADLSIKCADVTGDPRLRVYARGVAGMVFGTLGAHNRLERFNEMLDLAVEAGDDWHRVLALNNIACHHQEVGNQEFAERFIAEATACVDGLPGEHAFASAVVSSTQADIHLSGGRPDRALIAASESLRLLERQDPANPYVYAASVRAEVHALAALGRHEEARETGEQALGRLGDSLPRARVQVLTTLAQALRDDGRPEEAFDALQRAFDLERQSFTELSELQRILERATLEAQSARQEAECDWLTGLYNRRFLAREIDRLGSERRGGPVSVAAIDLDHFKAINDRFGHTVGDRVLEHAAELVTRLTRDTDIAVRSGGEEFLILMPRTEIDAARACCERIHEAIGHADWDGLSEGLRVTCSVGLASGRRGSEIPVLIARADQNLYAAKDAGRDTIIG